MPTQKPDLQSANRKRRYAGCALIAGSLLLVSGCFFANPFSQFAGESEAFELPGSTARDRLPDWPDAVDAADVHHVSYKSEWSRDSFATWYRIKLTPSAAQMWMDSIHDLHEHGSNDGLDEYYEGMEGVHRSIPGPPPQAMQPGEAPAWWRPPSIDFRATEAMLWYADYDSGVAEGTYSAFDSSSGMLWIYKYAAQHDRLWSPGKVPAGETFSATRK